jgi:hypothetical protein
MSLARLRRLGASSPRGVTFAEAFELGVNAESSDANNRKDDSHHYEYRCCVPWSGCNIY